MVPYEVRGQSLIKLRNKGTSMGLILIIVVLLLLFGGGGYYGYNRFGGAGLGGALGTLLIVLLILWLLGVLHA